MTTTGIIKREPGDIRTPLRKSDFELATFDASSSDTFRNIGYAQPTRGGLNHELTVVQGQHAWHIHGNLLVPFAKLPSIAFSAGQPMANAAVQVEVVGRGGSSLLRQIGRGCHGDKADIAAEPDGDHVLRHVFGKSDAGIEACLDNVDQTPIGDEIEVDIRIA